MRGLPPREMSRVVLPVSRSLPAIPLGDRAHFAIGVFSQVARRIAIETSLMPDEPPKADPGASSTPVAEPGAASVPKRPGLDLGPGVGVNVTQDMAAPERKLPP